MAGRNWSAERLSAQLKENPGLGIHQQTMASLVTTAADETQDIRSEHALQLAAFVEFDRLALLYPEYRLIYAVPNGQYRPGQRVEAGLKPGALDISWDWPNSQGFHGMRIELKVKKRKPSPEQIVMIDLLNEAGYFALVIWDSVRQIIDYTEKYRRGDLSITHG